GFACEFEIFLTPYCTMNLVDEIVIISLNIKDGKKEATSITINAKTENSTHLDYDELIEENVLGEGSFGVVYKGSYRKYEVAIKKMKQKLQEDANQLNEFKKEIAMLDKFRSDYLVHFFGAVFIEKKECVVTEFAQFGSLQGLLKHKKSDEVDIKMRIKMLLNAAKGISYLHENGILHRDIKPDNILVFSLDVNEKVNAKLTDFGSARNVNMLMTNMTFTKGIGTPKYMAPEVLERKKYKKAADVYSFAITMFEVFSWEEAFKKDDERFKYAWNIADFTSGGKRLEISKVIPYKLSVIITKSWTQETTQRMSIENVQSALQSYINII
ncbi:tyrosine kinase, putative, partial [Entamoeba invadens IP1]